MQTVTTTDYLLGPTTRPFVTGTSAIIVRNAFSTREGGLFNEVDDLILKNFDTTSLATNISTKGYDLRSKSWEKGVKDEARRERIFTYVSLADIHAICQEHKEGRNLLKTNGLSNLFFTRDNMDVECQIAICYNGGGFKAVCQPIVPGVLCLPGKRFFFLPHPHR